MTRQELLNFANNSVGAEDPDLQNFLDELRNRELNQEATEEEVRRFDELLDAAEYPFREQK